LCRQGKFRKRIPSVQSGNRIDVNSELFNEMKSCTL
jgi:hypothetical protein